MNESNIADEDLQFQSLEPFFTEEILNLITDQTNIYGKGKKRIKR